MVKGFRTLTTKNMGFDRNHVLTFHVVLPDAKYRDKDRIRGYYEQVLRNIQALPGVESAAAVTSLPAGGRGTGRNLRRRANLQPPPETGHPSFRKS